MSKVTINGEEIQIASTKKAVTLMITCLYPKQDRDKMSTEKRAELFDRAGTKAQTKYNFTDLKITDPEKLEDAYNLEIAIERTHQNHVKLYVQDVFIVVKPDTDPSKFETVNLNENHTAVTAEEVAASNEWYTTMTAEPKNHRFSQNLSITHDYFENNMAEQLVTKVNAIYLKYERSQRGGPLFFGSISSITSTDSKSPTTMVRMSIPSSVKSEASSSVSLITDKHDENAFPDKFANDLLNVFKTSSCEEFNHLFQYFSFAARINEFKTHSSTQSDLEATLRVAASQYRRLYATDAWTGVMTKSNQSGFVCFNCGDDHMLQDCDKPKHADCVKANKKLFYDKRSQGRGSRRQGFCGSQRRKWKPPTEKAMKPSYLRWESVLYSVQDDFWKLLDKEHQTTSAPSAATVTAAVAAAIITVVVAVTLFLSIES